MPDLATLQTQLWKWVTAPEGVAAALAAEAAKGGDGTSSVDRLISADARVPAMARLDVYAHAYFQRIHDVLAEDFGTLHAALGDDGFHDLVTAYLCVHPSEQPSLRTAGDALPGFLEAHPAAAPFRKRWAFAADLARFERALTHAFDAPDVPALRGPDLAALPAEAWADLALPLHPSVTRLALGYDVAALRESAEQVPTAKATRMLVWRSEETSFFREVSEEESDLLQAIEGGATFGALCDSLAVAFGDEAAPPRAAGWLQGWIEAGLIARAEAGRPDPT